MKYSSQVSKIGILVPFKRKVFDLESDVDVAIISSNLYDLIMGYIHGYQMELRENRKSVSTYELEKYHKFLEYGAIGWMRPDSTTNLFPSKGLEEGLVRFFYDSISYGRSEAGDYKVNAAHSRATGTLKATRCADSNRLELNFKLEQTMPMQIKPSVTNPTIADVYQTD